MERRCRFASSGAERAGIRFDGAVAVIASTGVLTTRNRLILCSALVSLKRPLLMPIWTLVQPATTTVGCEGFPKRAASAALVDRAAPATATSHRFFVVDAPGCESWVMKFERTNQRILRR